MSRAFVNEDAGGNPDPTFSLPEVDSPYYAEAAAWAWHAPRPLIQVE